MTLRKFGAAEVLSVHVGAGQQAAHVRKQAHRAVFSYVPREGYVYVRSRAISSRVNDNFDGFPAEEIEKSWQTFLGKPVFVNHHNSDHRQARGVIIDAALHRDKNPDGSSDTWVEVLMEVDALRFPKLAQALVKGDIDRTSMGVDVQISKCSACGNVARNPLEYCRHIPGMKGKQVFQLQPDGRKLGQLIYETCYGLSFFENSLLVEPPADPTAHRLGPVVMGPGLEHIERAARLQAAVAEESTTRPEVVVPLRRAASLTPTSVPRAVSVAPDGFPIALARTASRQIDGLRQIEAASLRVEAASKGDRFFEAHKVDPAHIINAFNNASDSQKSEGMDWYKHIHRTAKMITGGRLDSRKHDVVGGDAAKGAGLLAVYSGQSGLSDNHWKASKVALEGRGLGGSVSKGDPHAAPGFFADKTQADKAQRILDGEHHRNVLGLGSPKTSNFAHLIEHGGDDGSGHTAVCVDRHALSVALGRRVSDQDFGDSELSKPPNAADRKSGYTENHRYRMVADAYRHAAGELSKQHGVPVAPHQVQAVTWVVQRDMNNDVDSRSEDPKMKRLIKGRATNDKNAQTRWFSHVQTHYPEFGDQPHWKMTMLQRTAYNEQKAPQDVDTLRDEACPICGADIFNGSECSVCGYIQPPHGLDDPDVDKAKQLDQLKQNVEDARNESGLDPSQPGADFDAGDLSQVEPGGDNSNSPWLECNNCGTGLRPTPAQTAPTDPSQAGPALAEGDPCPVCEQGQLVSTGESEDDTDAEDAEAAEPGEQGPPPDAVADADDPDGDEDDNEDEEKPPTKSKKNPAGTTTAAMKYRDHPKEFLMQHGLASLAKLNEQQRLQAQQIQWLRQKVAVKDSQIQRLTAGLQALAQAAGPQADLTVRTAMLRKRADEQNPAQPIPEPAPQPPTQSTVEAETPEAFADVRAPGMVPGVNQDVAADAVTTAYTPGQDIAAPPFKQLVDVTAPIAGTQGPRPLSEVKTNVDVRAGNPMNPQVAFPLGGPFANAQRTGAVEGEPNDLRTMASIRLARLRIAAGIENGEDLSVGHRIASDMAMSMERINAEIETLNSVRKAAAASQTLLPPRGAVPRPAAPVQRIVPPLNAQGAGGFQVAASSRQREDDDLATALSL